MMSNLQRLNVKVACRLYNMEIHVSYKKYLNSFSAKSNQYVTFDPFIFILKIVCLFYFYFS